MAWQNIKTVGEKELGKQRLTSSLEYREWRKARIGQDSVPKKSLGEPFQAPHQAISQERSQLETVKAQLLFLEEKKQAADVEIVILQSRCQKMAKEIEALKDECADAAEITRSRKGKEKISTTHLVEIRELEGRLHSLVKERDELKKEVCKKSKIQGRLEVEVSK